jgi:putative nucleotidyltransferase with HDIG domain
MKEKYSVENAMNYINFAKTALIKDGIEEHLVEDFEKHCLIVAKAAKIMGSYHNNIDMEKLESLALLHDIGKYKLDRIYKRSHCISGYEFMKSEGLNKAANICMTHSFPLKRFNEMSEVLFFNNEDDIKFTKNFLSDVEFDIYDEIIQMADGVGRHNGFCSVEERFNDVAIRYNQPDIKKEAGVYLKLKNKLEKELGISIYNELGINNSKNRLKNYRESCGR